VALVLELAEATHHPIEGRHTSRPGRRSRRPVALAAFLVIGLSFGFIARNEIQANTQFDQAHHSLSQTDLRIDAVVTDLTAVRHDLRFLSMQIDASQNALSTDTTLLQGIRSALAQAQHDVSETSSYVVNLQTCQVGVEQALNALSVGDEAHAVVALGNVSAPCQNAAALSG